MGHVARRIFAHLGAEESSAPLAGGEAAQEPVPGQGRNLLERARLLEQVGRAGHYLEGLLAFQLGERVPVKGYNRHVVAADDEQGGRLHFGQVFACEVGAAAAVSKQNPAEVVVAVPVAARQTCDELAHEVDSVVCALTPDPFYAVGLWYQDFSPTTDEEVRLLLAWGNVEGAAPASTGEGETC